MIPCYFCKQFRKAVSACKCDDCAKKYQVELVATYYGGPPNNLIVDNTKIVFRLNKKQYEIVSTFYNDESTYVAIQSDNLTDWQTVLTLPGHPLTLDNFRIKLPLYLTFS